MVCDYGCNKEAKFFSKNGKKCCSSHWSKCEVVKKKRSLRAKGKNNPAYGKNYGAWNKGLTKETDERVAKYTKNMTETKNSNEYKEKHITWNKGLTKETNKKIAVYAAKISKTKTGVPNYKLRKPITFSKVMSKVRIYTVFRKHMYLIWTRPIMERDKFTCQKCGKTKELEVHHIKPFRQIFKESIEETKLIIEQYKNWTQTEIDNLHELIKSKHKLEEGITVCKICHGKIDNYRFFTKSQKQT